jgi:NAD(P)H-dependent FMN reductase
MKVLLFNGSSQSDGLNARALNQISQLLVDKHQVITDEVNNYVLPFYDESIDKHEINTILSSLTSNMHVADLLIIAIPEFNGSYPAKFKNLYDWLSVITSMYFSKGAWMNKNIIVVSATPGKRGGQDVLAAAKSSFNYNGGKTVLTISLPEFSRNSIFTDEQQEEILRKIEYFRK